MSPPTAGELGELEPEYRAELVTDLLSGRPVVWIEYRYGRSARRRRFYLVPDPGESFESVSAKIVPAIAAHEAANAGSRRA